MRLFVALIPPAAAVAELRAAATALHAEHPDLIWTRIEKWHLTLAFLGEVVDGTVPDLVERLDRATRRHPPMRLSLGGGGRFGNRVLCTQVHGETEQLRHLAGSVQAAARDARLPVDERPYRPHLTLARARTDATDLSAAAARLGGLAGPPWIADELHVVHSAPTAGPGGTSQYERIASWPLGPV